MTHSPCQVVPVKAYCRYNMMILSVITLCRDCLPRRQTQVQHNPYLRFIGQDRGCMLPAFEVIFPECGSWRNKTPRSTGWKHTLVTECISNEFYFKSPEEDASLGYSQAVSRHVLIYLSHVVSTWDSKNDSWWGNRVFSVFAFCLLTKTKLKTNAALTGYVCSVYSGLWVK